MKNMMSLILVSLSALTCIAAQPTPRLHFPNGFSIAPLLGKSDSLPGIVVVMYLATNDSFTPNVNVQILPYAGTIKDYSKLLKGQLKEDKMTVLKEELAQTSAVWEYSGTAQGREIHFYSKAEIRDEKIYCAIATALVSQWETVSTKLKACVNSLKTEKVGQEASNVLR